MGDHKLSCARHNTISHNFESSSEYGFVKNFIQPDPCNRVDRGLNWQVYPWKSREDVSQVDVSRVDVLLVGTSVGGAWCNQTHRSHRNSEAHHHIDTTKVRRCRRGKRTHPLCKSDVSGKLSPGNVVGRCPRDQMDPNSNHLRRHLRTLSERFLSS